MPELPEVETIKNALREYLDSSTLDDVILRREDIFKSHNAIYTANDLKHERLIDIRRHGKYLLFDFTNNWVLICHLRMTGKLIFLPSLSEHEQIQYLNDKHSHIEMKFSRGNLIYHDVRRFGGFYLCKTFDMFSNKATMCHIGYDALDRRFDSEYLYAACKKHPKLHIKALLLNQSIVAGIGNIYADEALFDAKIKPQTRAGRISQANIRILHSAIINVLNIAILKNGTSFSDYRLANNQTGKNQDFLKVYGKRNQCCGVCKTPLRDIQIAGRTTVYCPNCQK